ncbi:IS982 family transposase [Pontibacter sp. HSC-14F20]|uniref:IS982 family transposase n=1 Tax=Pontibacter sp. HSC-14F20 TaxID=2864136 RepID=UPI001C732FF0|nr:IS982 family transposase [Pontibacter sp. HSC-14F20]MBX0331746.1 IS982 family transposase [Pontibacter sp. HSC-14F20]
MTEQTITIYCFIDDFFHATGRKDDAHCKITDAELLTTALLSARFFYGNLHSAYGYMQAHHGVRHIDKSGFVRRLHRLQPQLLALFTALGRVIKELNCSCVYLIDSFPVPVCDNIPIPCCHLLESEAYRGKCVSKRRYFYGFRVQVVTTSDGVPVQFYIHAGSFADITAFKAMELDLPQDSELYADAAYTCYEVEDLLAECEQIEFRCCRKSNSRRKDEPHRAFLKEHYRKRIETTFSGITGFFPKKIHAVTAQGFILKLILFIFAYTLTQVIE